VGRARQGQLKLDAEINHAPNFQTVWSELRLDTFMQGINSGVTQGKAEVEPRGQVRLVLWKTREECEPEVEPRGQVGSTQDATGCLIYY
jgi:hypothetical protein